ncbi:MAG: NAD-dependent epimerase/dehydratase family protein [Flavobacteriaceae bacterium]
MDNKKGYFNLNPYIYCMVLVTGGTGLVGSHLLLQLLQDHVSVRATFRAKSDLDQVLRIFNYYSSKATTLFEKIEWVQADLNNLPELEEAFSNIDLVYHTAALISFDPGDYPKLKKINTEGTANIVNLCLANKVKKLCYVSTIGAIGKSIDGSIAHEENEWIAQNANVYALTKQAAEMEVWRGAQEGLDMVMVNPGVVLGPGFWKHGSGSFFSISNKAYAYYPPGGTGFVAVNDVVKALVALMNSKIVNERFILVAENLKFKEILGLIAEQLGKRKPSKELKKWQLQIGRFFDYSVNLFTGRGRRITKNSIHSLYHRDEYDNSKIKKAINFQFEPLSKTIAFCCTKFREENL